MIDYDPGDWGFKFVFQLRGSVFPKACMVTTPCTLFALLLHHLFHVVNPELIAMLRVGDAATNVFGGFTFILGFLVVFRSQQAYSRWWEGGTLLQQLRGEWFNSYSCLLAFCNHAPEKQVEVAAFQQQLVRLFSLLYGCALTQVSHMKVNNFELIGLDGMDVQSVRYLQTCHDPCEIALQWIQRLIVESEQKAILKIAPPILSRVFNELGNGIVNLNNARKIKEFPIPFPLAQMIMVLLYVHALMTPLISAALVDTKLWAGVITFIVIFSYWSILYIATELEMPFGDDLNDLPLLDMARDMNKSLRQLIDPLSQEVPKFKYVKGLPLRVADVDFGHGLANSVFEPEEDDYTLPAGIVAKSDEEVQRPGAITVPANSEKEHSNMKQEKAALGKGPPEPMLSFIVASETPYQLSTPVPCQRSPGNHDSDDNRYLFDCDDERQKLDRLCARSGGVCGDSAASYDTSLVGRCCQPPSPAHVPTRTTQSSQVPRFGHDRDESALDLKSVGVQIVE